MLDFLQSLSATLLVIIFIVSAAVVWAAGYRLSVCANTISERTGIGRVFIGALLLGTITSLPELVTSVTASANNNIDLAVNNLIGGVTIQVAILAIADLFVRRSCITTYITQPVIIVQGLFLILLMTIVVFGMITKNVSLAGIDIWSWVLFGIAVGGFYLMKQPRLSRTMISFKDPDKTGELINTKQEKGAGDTTVLKDKSNGSLYGTTVLLAVAVLAGGFFSAHSADLISQKTGFSASFMGFFFLAVATSLPEVSTTIAAVKIGKYDLAFSNIFGTNVIDISFIFFVDMIYRQGPVFDKIQNFSIAGLLVGIVLTIIYLAGIVIKPKMRLGNLGVDSLLVLLLYFSGIYLVYTLR